jgi:purine nucleosidase
MTTHQPEARRPVIIDCDPGQDDAVMLLLALAAPDELEVLGVTTVAGNVPLAKTTRNARLICDLAGRSDMRVHAGCDRPLLRRLVTAEHVHGREGIDGAPIGEPVTPLRGEHAVDFIVDTLLAAPENSITLVPTGPLTNIAVALAREPRIASRIREIVLMGGAWREGGNITPAAEFNVFVDPHAASVVLACGRPIVVMSLDVTHQAISTAARRAAIGALGTPVGAAVQSMLEFYNRHDSEKYGRDGGPLHDPCTIVWLLAPRLFTGKLVNVAVETDAGLTLGATVVDYWGVTDRAPNALWVQAVDADGLFGLLNERIGRL